MYRAAFTATPETRRGIILLVVLFMLTLFAIAGLSLVLYADAEATAARTHSEAANFRQPDMEPEVAFSYFMGQLIYDCLDDETGIYSALRGHSLSRNMYGLNTEFIAGQWRLQSPYIPYSGVGRLHYPSPFPLAENYAMVNYQFWRGDGFLRDPERLGTRPDGTRPDPNAARGPYVNGSVSYTYPDLNNMFLAAARADGTVLMPSFHRPWLFGPLDQSNTNWTNPHGRYMILRPRPVDHGRDANGQFLFPYPEDVFGDVKNWPWAPGGNDSIWIDIDAPVLTAPDGRKYKMLVAPLIIDLDGRINVNVHGNVLGMNADHRSNQGWGPWEVNLARVLNSGVNPNEWKNLVLGRQVGTMAWPGRFGFNGFPLNGGMVAAFAPTPRPYAPIDFDGRDENNGAPTMRMQVPAAGGTTVSAFPTWPTTGFGNGAIGSQELVNHPLAFNTFKPPASDLANTDDRLFGPHNMAALLKTFDTNSDALQNCDLLRLCPLNLNNPADPNSGRRRRMLTTASFDLDQPGITPYIWKPTDAPYQYTPDRGYPVGAQMPFPNPLNDRLQPPPDKSEFAGSTWHSLYAGLGRMNLDRPLRPYPTPDATSGVINLADPNISNAYNGAAADRVAMAGDLFLYLRLVTGAADPTAVGPGLQFDALRWLAQLAVNIVDYIDADDYMTVFNWVGDERVYGTELPRLVLNEVYVQYDNRAEDATMPRVPDDGIYRVNFWIELHNPFLSPITPTDNGAAVLQVPNGTTPYAAYKIMLLGQRDATLRSFDNTRGEPDPAQVKGNLTTWGNDAAKWLVQASNGAYSGQPTPGTQGFYVAGPEVTVAQAAETNLLTTFRSLTLTYDVTAADNPNPPTPTVLLRRLACPHLPPNPPEGGALDAGQPFNPYITVDFMEDVAVNDGRLVNTTGAVAQVPAMNTRTAWGKNQPYASFNHPTLRFAQAPMPAPPATPPQPKHTFYRHNAIEDTPPPPQGTPNQTLKIPFDWMVHLDRRLTSPVELLHVSAYKPHELTQRFFYLRDPNDATSAVLPFQHLAPWQAADTRIARLFSVIKTRSRYQHGAPYVFLDNGQPPYSRIETTEDGRVPGKININTIWDEEIFQALCDAGPSNGFTAAEVRDAWLRLLGRRTPNPPDPQGNPVLGPVGFAVAGPNLPDRPFLDVGTGFTAPAPPQGQYPNGVGVEDTILNPAVFNLLDQPGNPPRHPYQKSELLNKIYNNVTVRSNVFAVWATVGFFEVIDDSTKPVKLGAEIGRAEGRHVRHRMFAVVDRTNLSLLRGTLGADVPVSVDFQQQPPVAVPRAVTPPLPPNQMSPGGLQWRFERGQPVIWGPDTRQAETTTAVITDPTLPPTFLTTRPHAAGSHLIVPGNPGPWADYDPRRDGMGVPPVRKVVPYWAIID